jgi:hypothetical protein
MNNIKDVFQKHGPTYLKNIKLPLNQLKAIGSIEVCRTSVLGGHIDECEECGHTKISYNSCRNRHCATC